MQTWNWTATLLFYNMTKNLLSKILPSWGSHGVTCACLSPSRVLRRVETQKRDAFKLMVLALYLQAHPLKENRRTQLRGAFTGLFTLHCSPQVTAEIFPSRRKDSFSNWRSQELVGSLPANRRCCGEGLIPPTSLPRLSLNNSSINPLIQFLVPVHPSIYCLKINSFKTFSLPLVVVCQATPSVSKPFLSLLHVFVHFLPASKCFLAKPCNDTPQARLKSPDGASTYSMWSLLSSAKVTLATSDELEERLECLACQLRSFRRAFEGQRNASASVPERFKDEVLPNPVPEVF
ncbi:uncharacterized protein LOC124876180 [Girardinichthys multiradiatus]|uniref:uncharacterized protein LOC124876180 n=1 Tax=Girardinichthys multiradiatus TaxID=208333 RepID=UPI001FABC1A3|nr:uncharacterized protein LOC124876180 [Girardinichthys multiradiatus]